MASDAGIGVSILLFEDGRFSYWKSFISKTQAGVSSFYSCCANSTNGASAVHLIRVPENANNIALWSAVVVDRA